jgi:hypothetical protein
MKDSIAARGDDLSAGESTLSALMFAMSAQFRRTRDELPVEAASMKTAPETRTSSTATKTKRRIRRIDFI